MKHKESAPAVESDDPPASTVASSIFESVVFSGNIVKSIHTGEDEDSAAPSEPTTVPGYSSSHGEISINFKFEVLSVYMFLPLRDISRICP
jgi:hypothetical protein